MENIVPSWPGVNSESSGIQFTSHLIDFTLTDAPLHAEWIADTIIEEGFSVGNIDFIFCSDDFLLSVNQKHLGHNEYTDIITFPYEEDPVTGEIFISTDRVKENAKTFKTTFKNELRRVMIHGILHLCGYDDHKKSDIKKIREKEELYLSKW